MPTPLSREAMARRLAQDIPDGSYVNLGIGMPVLVAAHLPFPSVGRVAVDGDAFRWVPVIWDY